VNILLQKTRKRKPCGRWQPSSIRRWKNFDDKLYAIPFWHKTWSWLERQTDIRTLCDSIPRVPASQDKGPSKQRSAKTKNFCLFIYVSAAVGFLPRDAL